MAEGHPDVIEAIREGQVIRLEQIAAIWQAVHLRPHSGERVVAIVRDAHAMSEIVQNALLKSIEEPPPHAVTLLVTHLPHHLLATVRSRCQEIAIAGPPRREPAADWIVDVARAALNDPAFDPAAAVAQHLQAAGALERTALREVDERFAGRREGADFLPVAMRSKERKKTDAEHKELTGGGGVRPRPRLRARPSTASRAGSATSCARPLAPKAWWYTRPACRSSARTRQVTRRSSSVRSRRHSIPGGPCS